MKTLRGWLLTIGFLFLFCTKSFCLTSVCAVPGYIKAPSSVYGSAYLVSWLRSSTPGVVYVLEESTDSKFIENLRVVYRGDGLSVTIKNRITGLRYYYRVRAIKTGFISSPWQKGIGGVFVNSSSSLANWEVLGYSLAGYWFNVYAQRLDLADRINGVSSNYGSLLVTWYQNNLSSSYIRPALSRNSCIQTTPDDHSIKASIDAMHANGTMVMLRPYVDVEGWCRNSSLWRGNIQPSDIRTWFASYKNFILHYARIAEAKNVEMLLVGGELASLSRKEYRKYWVELIAEVRAVYSGKISYAATFPNQIVDGVNIDGSDEYKNVCFWDLLDFVGIDFYPTLTKKEMPTRPELVNALKSYLSFIESWGALVAKPIIFTEVGFPARDGCVNQPESSCLNNVCREDTYNELCQATVFDSFFDVFSRSKTVVGAFIYADTVNHNCIAPCNTDNNDNIYTVFDKLSEGTIKAWFQGR